MSAAKQEDYEMPVVSENQRRAMHAAAKGKSTIGIPKKVGREFADADQGGKLPKKVGQYSLPKSPTKVNAVLDAQSDEAVGMPTKTYGLPKSSKAVKMRC
jgi:hypothetical protein